MIANELTSTGQILTHSLQTSTYAYKRFASPALNGLSPFQLAFLENSMRY